MTTEKNEDFPEKIKRLEACYDADKLDLIRRDDVLRLYAEDQKAHEKERMKFINRTKTLAHMVVELQKVEKERKQKLQQFLSEFPLSDFVRFKKLKEVVYSKGCDSCGEDRKLKLYPTSFGVMELCRKCVKELI